VRLVLQGTRLQSDNLLRGAEAPLQKLDPKLLWLLIFASALTVGNIYYNQPLLANIAATFSASPSQTGFVSMATQLGYVCGLIFITPLGDIADKKKIIFQTLILAALGMLGCASAVTLWVLIGFSFFLGLTSIQVQLIIPFVADLSEKKERGRNLGLVLSSSLLGILLSRSFSGIVGGHFGWRNVFLSIAGVLFTLAFFLWKKLPHDPAKEHIIYPKLIHSLLKFFLEFKELRTIALTGALLYASFTAYWASIAFYLQGPVFHLGPDVVGYFGILGAGGAMASNLAGRYSDRIGGKKAVILCACLMIVAYLIMGIFGTTIFALALGVLLLDMGAQAASISNQTELYLIFDHSRTRLNTIYKVCYFLGGALGAMLSTFFWQHFSWVGVCSMSIGLLLLALMNHAFQTKTRGSSS
jgi:predicted MFS family arabinose efflux permease